MVEDELTRSADVFLRAFAPAPTPFGFTMGDVHRLSDGAALALCCVPGSLLELDPDGVERGRPMFAGGGTLGFVGLLDDPYQPG